MRECGYYWCKVRSNQKWYIFEFDKTFGWSDESGDEWLEEYFDEIDEKQIKRE